MRNRDSVDRRDPRGFAPSELMEQLEGRRLAEAAEGAHRATLADPPMPTLTLARAAAAACDWQTMPDEVVGLVAALFGVRVAALRSGDRCRRTVAAREVACWVLRYRLKMSYPEAARAMGLPSHSTVIGAVQRMSAVLRRERVLAGKREAWARKRDGGQAVAA